MTGWEKNIVDAFISHYFAHVPPSDGSVLRVRSATLFPDFDAACPNEKESYLEAAESLERKGIAKLNWEKRAKGERLKTLICENFEKLFEEAGRPYPKTEAEKIRAVIGAKVKALRDSPDVLNNEAAEKFIGLLEFISGNFGPREIGQGMDQQAIEELISFLEFSFEPSQLENITTRALSILLYRDSKRLENILALRATLLARTQEAVSAPHFNLPERSYPETMISGKIIFEYKNEETPLVNAGGHILGIPLDNAKEIESIRLVSNKNEKTVLTIENKETFFALASPRKHGESLSHYDCFLYTGGYPNRAVAALLKTLAASGFSFYHAGDLDPDGVLILLNVEELAGKPVTPLRMDAATFDQYRTWARSLTKPMLSQIEKIGEGTKLKAELSGLLRRIEETGLGVEQEIVDYRMPPGARQTPQ